jgi:molecular chaperone IbpA
MTHLSVFGPGFKDFDRFFVGFDDQFNRMAKMHDDLTKNIPNYPPYNIKKTGDNTYVIEIAVAGFARQDIEIELDGGNMVIKGSAKNEEEENSFLYRGIANRNFTRTFALEDQIEIKDAEMFNGMLKVFLERIIPEHKKPKKIEVKYSEADVKTSKNKKQLLTEDPESRVL